MSKVKIYGNANPMVGTKEYYSIHDFFGSSASSNFIEPLQNIPDENIKWSVWILLGNEWVKMTKNNKTGATVDYTFTQPSLKRKGIRMLVDANGEKAVLDIKTKENAESKILNVEILDSTGKKPTKLFSYGETITARVHCLNMEKFRINVTLWENDGGKKDLSDISIETKEANVLNGIADVKFTFNPSKVWLANAKTAPNEPNEGAFHEYYVTAEFYKKVSKPTQDINVINPDYKVDILSKTSSSKTSEKESKKTSPAQQKGPSKKETRGIAKADRKAHDHQEQRVDVKPTIFYDAQQEFINSLLMVNVGNPIWYQKKGTCVCKEYDLIWGNKVSCEFRKKVIEICKDLWKDNYLEMANNLMAVFYWETGGTFKPDVPNRSKSGATGLIQFMPERADEYFGKHTIEIVPNYFSSKEKDLHDLPRVAQFAKMSALEQLDYVKKYFEPQKNKKLKFVDFYLQVLFPVSSGKDEHVVFADKESKLDLPSENKKIKEKRVAKYSKNDGFDLNKDGKIYKSDIEKKVDVYKTKGLAYKNISECKNLKESEMIFSGDCTIGEVIDGFIINDRIVKNKVDSCNKTSMPEQVKIIVLHRTAGGKASGTLNWMESQGYGAHFVNDYDGTIYQAIGLDKKASHMGVNRKKSTLENGWGNGNSIGIETCGLSLDKDGISTLISKKTHDHWEPVTDKQAQSVACLLKFLLNHFNLSVEDVKIHEDLCLKTELEGKLVYDAMLPYLK